MNCPSCKAPLPKDAAFCPSCGADPKAPASTAGARTFSGLNTVAPIREARGSVLPPGTMFADRYEVIRKLGAGGMGVVYVAKDSNTGEELVLKLIHPDLVAGDDAVKRLMAEGLTARQIRHPNIVAVYDVALWNGQPYFTMEFVKGGTLRSWLVNKIGKDVPLGAAAGVISSILEGLAEAHRMGVVHRDLKPENVMLRGDPQAGDFDLKILDFGIAKAIGAEPTGGSGGPIGTPLYMAPEQMTSAEAVGPAADLYSLSVMFYEMLMEASPQSRWEPVSKNRPDVPKAIDALIEKGLSARPRSRYASAAEYEAALKQAMAGVRPAPAPGPPHPHSTPNPPPEPPDPRRPDPVTPGPGWQGLLGGMSKKAKLWTSGIAAVFVIGAMQNACDWPPDANGGRSRLGSGSQTGGGGGEVSTDAFGGAWFTLQGFQFDVTYNAGRFTARGQTREHGGIVLTGTVSEARGADFEVNTQLGSMGGTGTVTRGNGTLHVVCQFDDGYAIAFFVNHPAHQ